MKQQTDRHGPSPILVIMIVLLVNSVLVFFGSQILLDSEETIPTLVPSVVINIEPTPTLIATVSPQTHESSKPKILPTTASTNYQRLPPLPPQSRGLIFSGDRNKRVVALTFDVGETADNPAGFDRDIINVLNQYEVPATFFLGGLWMVNNEAEARELAENPRFELGNHAWSHLDFAHITPEEMSSEVLLTQQQMWALFDWQTVLFRLPYGTWTQEALDVIADHGMLTIQWDVVSGDPDPNILAQPMADWVLQQIQPGSIIIMHANGRGWHTAEALPKIIETLQAEGYTFVTVSDMLGLEFQNPYYNKQ